MNVVLVTEDEVIDNIIQLADHRAKHIVKVLHSESGDTIRIGIVNGKLGTGRIIAIEKKYPFMVEIEGVFDSLPPKKSPIDLLLALPRPIMLRRIFSQAASLGIETLHITHANRVEKSFWETGLIEPQEYMTHLIHGLEQAIDTVLPKVIFHRKFKPFIEDFFPTIADNYSHHVFAHPNNPETLNTILTSRPDKILMAIGPEGGWVDYEIEKFHLKGFQGFSIGERILKVDTAVVNIHGRMMSVLEHF